MSTLNLNNPEHNMIIVMLTLMYYSHGDVKDSYEEGYIKDSLSQHFNIETDEEIQKFLDDYAHLYKNYENLIYKS